MLIITQTKNLCDASSRGLGAVLPQEGRPLAYALKKWHQFSYGRHVLVNTDCKLLESIAKKPLDRAPKRLQDMLLRILAYDADVRYTPGHTQHLADMMSGSFIPAGNQGTSNEFEVINAVQFLPM